MPANHTVSLCAFWVWEYSFCLFSFRFAFEELNCFHDEFGTHFAWRFLIYFSIQISLISLCSPWENSVTDHINTVLTKSEFQLSPASPVAQSDVSIRQLSVTVSFVRRNWFTSDKKKWFSPASFLLLIAWNSETHWLTSFDASLIHLDRRWTCSADYDSCSLISDASWSISISQAVAPSLCLLVLAIFSSVWKTRFKFVSIYYFDPSTCHLSANMNAVQHDK